MPFSKTGSVTSSAKRKIVNSLCKLVGARLDEVRDGQGRHSFSVNVIVNKNGIRINSRPGARTVVRVDAPFDPVQAGYKVMDELRSAEGGAWSGKELADKFQFTPSSLHKRRKEHRIIYWRNAQNDFYYPRWQFTPAGALLRGVQEVLQTLQSSDEWRVMRYFLAPRRQLGDRTPLDLLQAGKVNEVVAHATAHGEENRW